MRPDYNPEKPVSIATDRVGDAVIIRVAGQINDLGADSLSAALDQVLQAGDSRIVFDLGEVRFLGSSGLGQIMRAYQAAKKQGGYVKVANPQPLIAEVFSLTKLDKILGIYPSVREALDDDGLEEAELFQ